MISENGWACPEKLSPATLKDFTVERMGEKTGEQGLDFLCATKW